MAALEEGVFSSRQFTFIIGKNQKTFTAHADIIAKQSKALNALINGAMAEASSGEATFDNMQEGTFERFCQFAYRGDYATPVFTHRLTAELNSSLSSLAISHEESASDHDDPAPADESEVDSLVDLKMRNKKSKKPSKSRLLRQTLDDKVFDVETIQELSAVPCEVRENDSE